MSDDINAKIEECTVTRDDINALIETSYKSAQERILRRMRTHDSNDGHDDKGHAGPPLVGSRTAPRRGGGRLNDPRRTARGRRAVTNQEDTVKLPDITEDPLPKARLAVRKSYEPICPHCGEIMYEKHYVPDHGSSGDGKNLFRHRGDCYDKGPFSIEWPKNEGFVPVEGKYAEATNFILEYRGKQNPPINQVTDHDSLKRLVASVLTVENCDRDWLYGVYRLLED